MTVWCVFSLVPLRIAYYIFVKVYVLLRIATSLYIYISLRITLLCCIWQTDYILLVNYLFNTPLSRHSKMPDVHLQLLKSNNISMQIFSLAPDRCLLNCITSFVLRNLLYYYSFKFVIVHIWKLYKISAIFLGSI